MAASEKHLHQASNFVGMSATDEKELAASQINSNSLGDLVCIGGTQVGVLRYFGQTHFETGLWCGVECADAVGKNDGSVMGVRYFTCKEKYGIFAPLSKVTLVKTPPPSPTDSEDLQGISNTKAPKESSTQIMEQSKPNNRPKSLRTMICTNANASRSAQTATDGAPAAPATTPVSSSDDKYLASLGIKRLKKDSKRGKDSPGRFNQQQKKKRKLDTIQKHTMSGSHSPGCSSDKSDAPLSPHLTSSHNSDLPNNTLAAKPKDEILAGGFSSTPLYSPQLSYRDTFNRRLVSSTPSMNQASKIPNSKLDRLRFGKFDSAHGTPRTSRGHNANTTPSGGVNESSDSTWCAEQNESVPSSPQSMSETAIQSQPNDFPEPLELSQVVPTGTPEGISSADEDPALSPVSSTKEDTNSDAINLEAFPAKRPSSISLFPGLSSEESSEQGIFGVSTPELIGGDSASLALSIPTSCCSSPEALDNESSLGLLTPSHLQECWNSTTNDEDLYQHLRSPSVDDLEEFEEEDKTVDTDFLEQSVCSAEKSRLMSSSLNGGLVVNENDGLVSIRHPMHHSLHEELHHHMNLGQNRVRRDQTYTQLPTVLNLNQQQHHHHLHQQSHHYSHHPSSGKYQHAALSFRGSGSGSGSGYCGSDPFTDSDFNTESEADHDHDETIKPSGGANAPTTGSNGSNSTSMKNRSARVIDGALYTSHHHQHNQHQPSSQADRSSPSTLPQNHHHQSQAHQQQQQHNLHQRTESTSGEGVGKSIDMISSSISVSVSSTSASACASEMESSGFYSDASERNPSGGSVMSESDGYRSSRHLSKSSSECDESVAMSMGMKMVPLKPLTQSEDDSIQIFESSSIFDADGDDLSSFEAASLALDTSLNLGERSTSSGETVKGASEVHAKDCQSPKKVSIVKTNPPVVEYQKQRDLNTEASVTKGAPATSNIGVLNEEDDLCEDMDVDLFAEYEDEQEMETMNNNPERTDYVQKAYELNPNKDVVVIEFGGMINATPVTCESGKEQGLSVPVVPRLGASHEEMELELVSPKVSEPLSTGTSPLTSPMLNNTVIARHGNVFVDGEMIADLLPGAIGGGGGGIACFRSQSVNCIASLTSSTSSASTVTAKSCITATGAPSRTRKSLTGTSSSSFRSRIPSIEAIPLMCEATKDVKAKVKGKAGNQSKINKSGNGAAGNCTSGKSKTSMTATADALSAASNGNSSKPAEHTLSSTAGIRVETQVECVVSTTTGENTVASGNNTNRRSSRLAAASGKSPACGGKSADTSIGGASSKANISATSSVSSSSDLNRTSRSQKLNNVHGSTRSLASVGLATTTTATSKSSPASKKVNKWDAVMSRIAETKHKTINVKDVKSKVFTSTKSSGPGSEGGTSKTTTVNNGLKPSMTGKMVKGAKNASSRTTLIERSNENDPLVPPAMHRRQQHHFSSRSSTVSDSSLDEHPQRGPPPLKHRVKKDAPINRRQVSDLSSASDYSTTQSKSTSNNTGILSKAMTTGSSTRRPQRNANNANSNTTGVNGTKGSSSAGSSVVTNSGANKPTNNSAKTQGTKGAQVLEANKKKGVNSSQTTTSTRGVTTKSKGGSSTVSTQNDPSTKAHPAVKPLRDRNRLGPVGKNYGSPGLDANANESDPSILHGQTNGELEPTAKPRTKVSGATAADHTTNNTSVVANNNNTSGLIITKTKSSRVSSTNQQNIQNSVLIQENSSLKEELSRLTSVVTDLQEKISELTASEVERKKNLETAETRIAGLGVVVQQCDREREDVYQQFLQQQKENKIWRQRLDEKLAELHSLQDEYEKEREQNQAEQRKLQEKHENEVDVIVRNCENKLEQLQKRHDETLAELKRSHTEELERLQESQRQELEQTIQKHKELLDQHRNQSPHDILHKEVASLQVVVEMRNEEIRVLRKDLMDYKTTLNDLQMAREHGKSLVAKIEDLEAQLEKARADKRNLQEQYQALEMQVKQIESENTRLVRCNEELNWKIKSYDLVEN